MIFLKKVGVGSGFSIKERQMFFANPSLIMGKTISVQYLEETDDGSLRHPSYKGIYGKNRNW